MKKNHILIFISCSVLFMPSCKIMYTPNMQNVPLLKEKNEVRATVGFSDYQAAYALTNNIGIMVNGQYKKPTWTLTSGSTEYKYESKKTLIEGGAGYFKPLGKNGIFETYAGGGMGSVTFDRSYSDTTGGPSTSFDKYSAKTTRYFIQPSIGLSIENLDFAFSTRFVSLKFSNIDTAGYTPNGLFEQDLSDLDKTTYMFIEPALILRLGWKYVKFHFQALLSLPLNSEPINFVPFSVNFGIHINIAPRYKNGTQPN